MKCRTFENFAHICSKRQRESSHCRPVSAEDTGRGEWGGEGDGTEGKGVKQGRGELRMECNVPVAS